MNRQIKNCILPIFFISICGMAVSDDNVVEPEPAAEKTSSAWRWNLKRETHPHQNILSGLFNREVEAGCDPPNCLPECEDKSPISNGSFYFGAELLYLEPTIENNSANRFVINRTTNFLTGGLTQSVSTPDYDFDASPRITLGYEDACGSGIRFRGWYSEWDSSAIGQNNDFFPFIQTDAIDESLRMQTYDLEFTKRAKVCDWSLLGSVGIRYAKGNLDLSRNTTTGIVLPPVSLNSETEFEGWGPTLGLESRRSFIGCGITAVAKGRVSYLSGETSNRLTENQFFFTNVFENTIDSNVPVTEFYVGLEKCIDTKIGQSTVGIGLENQTWHGLGDSLTGGFPSGDSDIILKGLSLNLEGNVEF